MFETKLIPANMPRIIKLQYSAVLKSFLGNLKRRENKRKTKEAITGATMRPSILSDINNITNGVLFKKFIRLKNFLPPKLKYGSRLRQGYGRAGEPMKLF